MVMPTSLEINSSVIERIFAQMPSGFSRDPLAIDAINFFIARPVGTELPEEGPAIGVIRDGVFTITSAISSIANEEIILKNYTINQLCNYFNEKREKLGYGIYCAINTALPITHLEKSACCLIEGSLVFEGSGIAWPEFTSPNYSLIAAIALALIDNQQKVLGALRQTDQQIAAKEWLDYWGLVLGVQRIATEIDSDTIYRNRMRREAVFPKSNNWSIAFLLRGATGKTAFVNDGGQPFLLVSTATDKPSVSHGSNPALVSTTSYIGIGSRADIGNTNPVFTPPEDPSSLFKIGPNTGSGGFVVKISGDNPDGSLSQPFASYIYELVTKYKPAAIPFTIQPL